MDIMNYILSNRYSSQFVQPNWNQNDPSMSDYIKNRTHWVGKGATIIDNETLTFTDVGDGLFYSSSGILVMPDIGDICTITFDGIEYNTNVSEYNETETVSSTISNGRILGNKSIENDNYEDTGEPFLMLFDYYDEIPCVAIITNSSETEHTINIFSNAKVYYKLDNKYLNSVTTIKNDTTNIATEGAVLNYGNEIKSLLISSLQQPKPLIFRYNYITKKWKVNQSTSEAFAIIEKYRTIYYKTYERPLIFYERVANNAANESMETQQCIHCYKTTVDGIDVIHMFFIYGDFNNSSPSILQIVMDSSGNITSSWTKIASFSYVDNSIVSALSFNESGELVVTLNGVTKTFVAKE